MCLRKSHTSGTGRDSVRGRDFQVDTGPKLRPSNRIQKTSDTGGYRYGRRCRAQKGMASQRWQQGASCLRLYRAKILFVYAQSSSTLVSPYRLAERRHTPRESFAASKSAWGPGSLTVCSQLLLDRLG